MLDVGPAVHQQAGLSRYTERLAAHLLSEQSEQTQLTLLYNAHSGHGLPATLAAAPTHTIPLGQYGWRLSVLASQILRAPIYTRHTAGAQLYHATEHLLPYLPNTPTVLTVHDLIFEEYPEHHTRLNRLFLQTAMPLFVKAADAIIAVSQQTRRDLIARYQTPSEKIHVIYEGLDPHFQPASQDAIATMRQQYNLHRPYLLMVGTLDPRKNHAAAFRALARIKEAGCPLQLVIVGGKGWLFEPVRALVDELGLTDDVIFVGYVPDEDLSLLYSGADCLLQPSLYEGFGFPILEAMACGTPVICSNSSSLPEVAGDVALQVSPHDDEELAASIQKVLSEPGLADRMREQGVVQAGKFSWDLCATETMAVYENQCHPVIPSSSYPTLCNNMGRSPSNMRSGSGSPA